MIRKLLSLTFTLIICVATVQSQDNKPLFSAVENNDIASVKKLLEQGVNPNAVDDYGDAVLMNAGLYASVDCMKLLLDKGADPNFKNKQGETCLMWCVQDSNKVNLLLSKGADINIQAKSGNTALLIAVVGYNNYDLVKMLIDKGADPMATNRAKETALIRAAPFCDSKMINLLLENGNAIDSLPLASTSALITAILYSNSEACITLLEKGADPDKTDSFGGPLAAAVLLDDTAVINLLIKKTKDINKPDASGVSPLAWACYNEHDRTDIIQSLIDHGAIVNVTFKNGSTPLSWALQKGDTKTVDILKRTGEKK